MRLLVVRRGIWTLLAVSEGERCPLKDDLEKLEQRLPNDVAKIMRRFAHVAEHGLPRNKELCRHLEDGIFELKAQRSLIRVLFFLDEDRFVVCTHAVSKPKKRQLRSDMKKAKEMRDKYLEAKHRGRLEIVEELT